jgi:hypothetical protein
MASASPLSPTFYGHVASTQDALLLFEACLSGALNHLTQRPHDRERVNLIKTGNVFIYEEHSSCIKRWTDGVPWSPSRILGNFLVYRELERPFPPGEKRTMKGSKRSPGISKRETFRGSNNGMSIRYSAASAASSSHDSPRSNSLSKETERSLIGSLVDSYGFKDEGLVKKTLSVTVGGVSHHLVAYYTVADVMNNKFTTPSKDPRFQHITPRPDLITKQIFRAPIDEVASMDRLEDGYVYASYPYVSNGYGMTNQSISHRLMSLPIPPIIYPPNSGLYIHCGTSYHSGHYNSLRQGPSNSGCSSQFSSSPGSYPGIKTENYNLRGCGQQQYNSAISIGSDITRSQISSVTTARPPWNFEQESSIDSGLSGTSSSSFDSEFANDPAYLSQGFIWLHSNNGLAQAPPTSPHDCEGGKALY